MRFAADAQNTGLSAAIDARGISINTNYVAPSIALGLWNLVASQMGPSDASSLYGRLAEKAFKNAITHLLSNEKEVTPQIAEKNLLDFLAQEGREGLATAIVTGYLYELSLYYLHTGKNPPAVKEDTGYRFYVDGRDRVLTPERIESFKRELRNACEGKAKSLVENLVSEKLFENLGAEERWSSEVTSLLVAAFQKVAELR